METSSIVVIVIGILLCIRFLANTDRQQIKENMDATRSQDIRNLEEQVERLKQSVYALEAPNVLQSRLDCHSVRIAEIHKMISELIKERE